METFKQQNQSEIIIENATFSNKFTKEIKQSLIKQHHTQIMKQSQWNIWNKTFTQNKWSQIIPYMKQVKCSQLIIINNRHSQIILNITQPVFSNLKILRLGTNNITSIEALSFSNTQNLQTIGLDYNLITSMKSLNKTKWNQVNQLYINDNKIKEIQLNRMKFNKLTEQLWFQYFPNHQIPKEDISFIMKLQSNRIQKILIKSDERINQQKVIDSSGRKYDGIIINPQR